MVLWRLTATFRTGPQRFCGLWPSRPPDWTSLNVSPTGNRALLLLALKLSITALISITLFSFSTHRLKAEVQEFPPSNQDKTWSCSIRLWTQEIIRTDLSHFTVLKMFLLHVSFKRCQLPQAQTINYIKCRTLGRWVRTEEDRWY